MADWQDIETAPKDDPILVYDPSWREVTLAAWDHEDEAEGGQVWRATDAIGDRLRPTHWMPLPEPPK